MRDRAFIATVALVAALSLLILAGNIRDAGAPLYGPPNVDQKEVMSKVESGWLSFEEARFYSPEENRSAEEEAAERSSPHKAGTDPPGGGNEGERDE